MTKRNSSYTCLVLILTLLMTLTGCGRNFQAPAINETGNETATEVITPGAPEGDPEGNPGNPEVIPDPSQPPTATPQPEPTPDTSGEPKETVTKLIVNQAMVLRHNVKNILELKVEIPAGTQIEVPKEYTVEHLDYRKADGTVERSSTGFITPVKILTVPDQFKKQFPQDKIDAYNATSGGIYITAAIVGAIQGISGNFEALVGAAPISDFLKNYEASGKPKFSFTSAIKKRWGDHVNKAVDPSTQSEADRAKWTAIYNELKKFGDRTVPTAKGLLMVELEVAKILSETFEKTGQVPPKGAWTVAVQATAPRHGFANVPCAEFMSETIRQAYKRAGYEVADDFSKAKGNYLIWSESAAVVNLSNFLDKAGWVPWDTTVYRPLTGSILMNGSGKSPGHTYMSGGDDGRFIVDNGAPQGRDLRKTVAKTTEMMYMTGVFFLPPGVNPPTWDSTRK